MKRLKVFLLPLVRMPVHHRSLPSNLSGLPNNMSVPSLIFFNIFIFISSTLAKHLLLRTFAPIATAHLYCARHSLSTHAPRHFQARALSRKLNKNIEPVTLALTWCANIFVGCSVTPNLFLADHFLFRFSPLY